MAIRKTAPEPEHTSMGITSDDIQLDRLRIAGPLSDLFKNEIAGSGDIALGASTDDEDSAIVKKGESIRVYALKMHPNYACSYKAVKDDPTLQGTWEEGDPSMPPAAKRQFNYVFCIPSHSKVMPVVYTASSSAAREAKQSINKRLGLADLAGEPAHELAFEMSTKTNRNRDGDVWPGPQWKLAAPDAAELEIVRAMHKSVVGPPRAQLETETGADAPGF